MSDKEIKEDGRAFYANEALKEIEESNKRFVTSGFFNCYHQGHAKLIEECRKIAGKGKLIVIVNNDKQVKIKGSPEFMTQDERMAIMRSIKGVDEVILSIDTEDSTISKTLEMLQPVEAFLKGGDRRDDDSMPKSELEVCKKYGTKIVYGVAPVGGSSTEIKSRMRANIRDEILAKVETKEEEDKIRKYFE